ncbi:MAG TPA: general stress protein [Microbacteriaceae bacterium]|nr:general stress protein [Microbacteriaceae bacterium]
MSTQNPFPSRARRAIRRVPHGDIVASFATYREAQQAVDGLVKAEFPVEQVAIVGSDLKTVERVTGRLTWGRVALAGAASGAWLGIFLGVLFSIFSAGASVGIIGAAVMIGAGFGMLFGVASYAINRRRKDFTSMTQVLADRYDLIVDPQFGGRAGNLLAEAGVRSTASAPRPGVAETLPSATGVAGPPRGPDRRPRPRYGEYVSEPPAQAAGQEAAGTGSTADGPGDGTGAPPEDDGDTPRGDAGADDGRAAEGGAGAGKDYSGERSE